MRSQIQASALLISIFSSIYSVTAAAAPLRDGLIVQLRPGVIRRAIHSRNQIKITDVASPRAQAHLLMAGVIELRPIFPDFDPSQLWTHNQLGEPVKLRDLSDYYALRLRQGAAPANAVRILRNAPDVRDVAENWIAHATTLVPDDSLFSSQWWADNSGSNGGCNAGVLGSDCDINAPEAWSITTGSSDVTVAVLDSGVEEHPEMNN